MQHRCQPTPGQSIPGQPAGSDRRAGSAADGEPDDALLTAAHGTANDFFGDSVALRGTTAMVGTPGKNANTGAAYVFVKG